MLQPPNRRTWIFLSVTLVLGALASVVGVYLWHATTVTIAVGPADSDEAKLLTAYADTLRQRRFDPRVQIVYDDARHFVLTTREKFDIITSDPIHPWVKGSATLYSKEYYELVKRHLNPGGVVAQWLPIYDSDAETVRTELATFFTVFPAMNFSTLSRAWSSGYWTGGDFMK